MLLLALFGCRHDCWECECEDGTLMEVWENTVPIREGDFGWVTNSLYRCDVSGDRVSFVYRWERPPPPEVAAPMLYTRVLEGPEGFWAGAAPADFLSLPTNHITYLPCGDTDFASWVIPGDNPGYPSFMIDFAGRAELLELHNEGAACTSYDIDLHAQFVISENQYH